MIKIPKLKSGYGGACIYSLYLEGKGRLISWSSKPTCSTYGMTRQPKLNYVTISLRNKQKKNLISKIRRLFPTSFISI